MGDEVFWTKDEQELIDFLAEAVSASLDVDWTPQDAAKSIIAAMFHEGLCIARTEEDDRPDGWKKAELEQWAQGWSRTPATVLKAFIDAGFCSDQAPAREETRLATPDHTAERGEL